MKLLQNIVLLLLTFFVSPMHSSGFALGTLVKTPNGYCPIEQIAIGDLVVGFDVKNHCFIAKPVTAIVCIRVPKYQTITCDDVMIIADKKQQLYVNNVWIRAAKIQPSTCLSTSSHKSIVRNNVQTNQCIELYDLVVQDVHTFCVTEKDIIAHNFIISIGLAWGAGVEIVYSIGIALIPVIAAISEWFSEKQKNEQIPSFEREAPKEHPHGKYHDVPYHHKNSKGNKNPSPKNGQEALDKSIPISLTSKRRVGISEGEIVVLDKTAESLYHGHVRTWQEIIAAGKKADDIRRALLQNGFVKKCGEIINGAK